MERDSEVWQNYLEILKRLQLLKSCSEMDPKSGRVIRWHFLNSSVFCAYHTAQVTLIPEGLSKSYKATIDWVQIIPRVYLLQPVLQAIINGTQKSSFRIHMLLEYEKYGATVIEGTHVGCYDIKKGMLDGLTFHSLPFI